MSTPAPPLCHRPDDVTPEWMTDVLRASGDLTDGAVASLTSEPIGTGQMADSVRFTLTYDGDASGPATVVIKFASSSDTSRATGTMLRSYECEVGFYRELAGTVGISTPHCYHADVEPATGWFTLVLGDMAPAEQGDQIAGCSPDVAALAMDQAVRLHAPRWNDPTLLDVAWFSRPEADTAAASGMFLGMLFPGWVDRYQARLDADTLDVCQKFITGLNSWLAVPDGPRTIQHGDYRLDNMLFGDGDTAPALTVVDWQTVSHGHAMADVSYFLGTCLPIGDREQHEQDLVRHYYDGLLAAGVDGYSWDECWHDYRYFSFFGIMMAIGSSMLVEQTDRGDDMFMAFASRAAAQVLAHDALDLLSSS